MNSETVELNITGIVQGVGFRPFLYNLARTLELKGYVLNRGNAGVRLILQGDHEKIKLFLDKLRKEKPDIAYIEDIDIKYVESSNILYSSLEIKKSEQGRGISLTLPPDIAMCKNCLRDMRNQKKSRYYRYPFTACAVCGPRFTTVKELPYDRIRTTMTEFPFCESCLNEYSNFNNRRFHAQTFSCAVCGPKYTLYEKNLMESNKNPINEILLEVKTRIKRGEIGAIKGIGGIHLVCLADQDEIVLKLRNRKGERKNKPFALMVPDLDIIKDDFEISDVEKEILYSFRRPIVLLNKRKNRNTSKISEYVAPGLNNIGFMLPYSGIHHLLFDYIGNIPLIYTSGNSSHIPMAIENYEIFKQLDGIADFYLLHNRKIHQRADDSVLRVHDNKKKLIRRSRGFVPEYFSLPFESKIPGAISTGPELNVTGAVMRRNRIFPTQHIGNVTRLETYTFLKDSLIHMKNLLQIKDSEIKFISTDAHPLFETTKLGKEFSENYNVPIYSVQHHYAHILGLMAENKVPLDEKIIGISTDGVGYGDDGKIWGGEILLSSYNSYKRLGHLQYQPMIGGDRCTTYPARMLASILLNTLGESESVRIFKDLQLAKDLEYKQNELNVMMQSFNSSMGQEKKIPYSSSTGRIFDSVSYLLKCCTKKTYRGEPAMRLEGLAYYGNPKLVDLEIETQKENNIIIINTSKLILDIINLIKNNRNERKDIAAKFQIEIGRIFGEISVELANKMGVSYVGLTGGVSYNYNFSKSVKKIVQNGGLEFLEHFKIAPGDAGISIGQMIGGLFQYHKNMY